MASNYQVKNKTGKNKPNKLVMFHISIIMLT